MMDSDLQAIYLYLKSLPVITQDEQS